LASWFEHLFHDISAGMTGHMHVEDDRTGMEVGTLKRALADNLYCIQGKDEYFATAYDYYMALAYTVRDRLTHRRIKTAQTYFERDAKMVYYLSAEFLIGRLLINNLINLGMYDQMRQALKESGLNLDDLLEREEEPGLGNAGNSRNGLRYPLRVRHLPPTHRQRLAARMP
jgi:starch phosphorylase